MKDFPLLCASGETPQFVGHVQGRGRVLVRSGEGTVTR